ncbi:MAG: hypothetical protein EPN91_07175 [Salinibacterium sp.]|nr:MAG: hypothetical protein EPN91_07175 [Salinibacterium sp.]
MPGGLRFDDKRKITVLVRQANPPAWKLWSQHDEISAATEEIAKRVTGKGVTAWSWWGPTEKAARMLSDPNYHGAEEAEEAPSEPEPSR